LYKTPFARISKLVEESGENIPESFYDSLTVEQQKMLVSLLEPIKAVNDELRKANLAPELRKQYQERLKVSKTSLQSFIEAPGGRTEFQSLEADIKKFAPSQTFDVATYNRLSGRQIDSLKQTLKKLNEIPKLDPNPMFQDERQKYQKNFDNLITELIQGLENPAKRAGEDLSAAFGQGLSTSLQMLLSGKKFDETKSKLRNFIDNILDVVSQSVIKSLSEGFSAAFMKDAGLKEAGEQIYEAGAAIFKNIFGNISKVFSENIGTGQEIQKLFGNMLGFISDGVKSLFSSITGGGLTELISGAGKVLKDLFLNLLSFVGFANGGYVRGPGTGTSDSIPAMLSNGEFVVNAKATKENFKLLSAINNGSSLLMANGGLVSSDITKVPEILSFDKNNRGYTSNNSQIVNINITGDITRQTRSEIFKMLPTIADGVNMQNKERNYRG
jgi:hypothetical protein